MANRPLSKTARNAQEEARKGNGEFGTQLLDSTNTDLAPGTLSVDEQAFAREIAAKARARYRGSVDRMTFITAGARARRALQTGARLDPQEAALEEYPVRDGQDSESDAQARKVYAHGIKAAYGIEDEPHRPSRPRPLPQGVSDALLYAAVQYRGEGRAPSEGEVTAFTNAGALGYRAARQDKALDPEQSALDAYPPGRFPGSAGDAQRRAHLAGLRAAAELLEPDQVKPQRQQAPAPQAGRGPRPSAADQRRQKRALRRRQIREAFSRGPSIFGRREDRIDARFDPGTTLFDRLFGRR